MSPMSRSILRPSVECYISKMDLKKDEIADEDRWERTDYYKFCGMYTLIYDESPSQLVTFTLSHQR